MRLIGLVVVLAVSLTLAPLVADAQQPGKVYRIGFLFYGAPGPLGRSRRLFGKGCVSSVTSKGRTLPSNTDSQAGS
jgi:hypothetical protein